MYVCMYVCINICMSIIVLLVLLFGNLKRKLLAVIMLTYRHSSIRCSKMYIYM